MVKFQLVLLWSQEFNNKPFTQFGSTSLKVQIYKL